MKIFCEYCGTAFNDTETVCPHCGAPSSGVKRTASKQPKTIAELEQWYRDRGLPPYETTRFFIGVDYRKARAFGIYRDDRTGNFVVYKNKSDGSRAVRYEGTDEAYAVNELYQRLKQEIIQQKKAASAGSKPSARNGGSARAYGGAQKKETWLRRQLRHPIRSALLLYILLYTASSLFAAAGIRVADILFPPSEPGYYQYDGEDYYCLTDETFGQGQAWFIPEDNGWYGLAEASVPEALRHRRSAKPYYSGGLTEIPETLYDSEAYSSQLLEWSDAANDYLVDAGYYDYAGVTYYHATNYDSGDWYYWDDGCGDWVSSDDTPDSLQHGILAEDFFYTPVWDESTQYYDFEDSTIYADSYQSHSYSSRSYDNDDSGSWSGWDDDDDDSDYDWDSDWGSDWDSGWDSGSSDWDSDW